MCHIHNGTYPHCMPFNLHETKQKRENKHKIQTTDTTNTKSKKKKTKCKVTQKTTEWE